MFSNSRYHVCMAHCHTFLTGETQAAASFNVKLVGNHDAENLKVLQTLLTNTIARDTGKEAKSSTVLFKLD